MAGPTRAFNEVKALLNKLDRGIDEARVKRLAPAHGDSQPKANAETTPAAPPTSAQPSGSTIIGGPPQNPASPANKPTSAYGRARPLRPGPTNQADWR
ncbi:MAG: hypothetical protein KF866_05255 [Phycisphaeraceae bacterium]|nr:hypothetical protein [Phycisphaeraceae bacterium]MCW5754401.1 hypothetical protein [Phycisphaeraceae bacterium]